MFSTRDQILVTCLFVAFALAPCRAQMGALQQPGFPGSASYPAAPQQNVPNVKEGTGMITGSVRTMDNKPMSNARIEVVSVAFGRQMTPQYTSRDGSFIVSNLRAGEYEVRAESGVQEVTQRVQVGDGQNWVMLRMPNAVAAGGGENAPAVSVQQLRVPDRAVSLLDKAHQAMDKNKLDEAAKDISKALAIYPEYAQALTLRGVLEMQQEQYQEAAADANHAIQADPNYGTGYLVMGAALNCQKKFQDALRPLQRAETLLPNAWQGYFESGKALLQLGRFQEALQQANRALALARTAQPSELHLVKGYAYLGLHTYGGALTEFQQYLSQAPAGTLSAQVRSTVERIRPLVPTAEGAAAGNH